MTLELPVGYDMVTDAEAGVRAALRLVNVNPDEAGVAETPARWLRALVDVCTPHGPDPAEALAKTFHAEADEMVAVGPLPFTSLCEHHLMTVTGRAWIAYLPTGGKVVGLSKLPRVLDWYAARPQLQERMTRQVTDALVEYLTPDAACLVEAAHGCMSSRGVRKAGAVMRTTSLTGRFRENSETRAEFMAMIGPMG
ncbi:GTP cyclohydrolase I [Streptomyces sp. NPDC088739]|uniref:GTP cyclohydrolase I n=1 Tax=Streptomyces sp. NPDC088739 TaxID=3365882 RepID=UPI0037F99A7D